MVARGCLVTITPYCPEGACSHVCHVPLPAYVHTVLDPSLATRWHRRACLVTLWHICMYPPGEDSGSPVHLLPVSECRDGRKAVNACTLAVSRHCHTAVWPHPLTNLQYFSTTTGACGQALLAAMPCPSDATRWRRQACSHTLHTCPCPSTCPLLVQDHLFPHQPCVLPHGGLGMRAHMPAVP